MSLANMSPAQKQVYFAQQDRLLYSMFQVFAAGPAMYAGSEVTAKACTQGIKAVFDWWCRHGVLLGGEKDLKDVAAQVAETVARTIYEAEVVQNSMASLTQYMMGASCGPKKTGRMYSRPGRSSRR